MWAVGAAVVGVISSAYSSYKGREASKEATEAITQAENKSNETQLSMYEQSRQDQLPWMRAGERALGELERIQVEGPGEFKESPYYRLGEEEETRAIDTYLASRGLYGSGKAGKALKEAAGERYARNRGNWLNEWISTKLAPAQSAAGVGQTAATNIGAQGIYTGRDIAGGTRRAGEARGADIIARQNITTEALQSGANALAQYYGSRSTPTTDRAPMLEGPVRSDNLLLA